MNQNRPFFTTNTNCYDESFRSSAPTNFNGESIIFSQEQLRRVCDTLNTSIISNPSVQLGTQPMLVAHKQYFPGGVMFSFTPIHNNNQFYSAPRFGFPPTNNYQWQEQQQQQQPVAVNTFFPTSMDCQPMPNWQVPLGTSMDFKLKFHSDCGTSSTDLLNCCNQKPGSRGYPEFNNITGIVAQSLQDQTNATLNTPSMDTSTNAHKLIFCNRPQCPTGHIVDVLDEQEKNENLKKVSFTGTDKCFQVTSDCICDSKKCKAKTKSKKKFDSSTSNTSSEASLCSDKKQKTKTGKNSKKDVDSNTSDTESDKSIDARKKQRKKKKDKVNESHTDLSSSQ